MLVTWPVTACRLTELRELMGWYIFDLAPQLGVVAFRVDGGFVDHDEIGGAVDGEIATRQRGLVAQPARPDGRNAVEGEHGRVDVAVREVTLEPIVIQVASSAAIARC